MIFQEPINPNTYVLYHADCNDGIGAALAAYNRLRDAATYIPIQYGHRPPKLNLEGADVYILDFCYDKDIVLDMRSKAKRVTVIDHHDTNQKKVEGLDDVIFDMTKSGAVLAWEFFNPDAYIPLLLKHIQDRDLWKFEYSESRFTAAYLKFNRLRFKSDLEHIKHLAFVFLSEKGDQHLEEHTHAIGRPIHGYLDYKAKDIADKQKFKKVYFEDYQFAFYNQIDDISETAAAIYNAHDVDGTLSYFIKHDKVIFSLRSKKINVREIAEKWTGGGHDKASGFTLPLGEGLELIKDLYGSTEKGFFAKLTKWLDFMDVYSSDKKEVSDD